MLGLRHAGARAHTVAGITNATAIAAGNAQTCALLASGSVECWGEGISGELGDGMFADSPNVPVVVEGITNAVAVAAGTFSTCAVLDTHRVECWGRNDFGELADGTTDDSAVPQEAEVGVVSSLAPAPGCALVAGGSVECWGPNEGDLGDGSTEGPESCFRGEQCSLHAVGVVGISDAEMLAGGESGHVLSLLPVLSTAGETGVRANLVTVNPAYAVTSLYR